MTKRSPVWISCRCGGWWCTAHRRHVSECACPPIEEWGSDPYTDPYARESIPLRPMEALVTAAWAVLVAGVMWSVGLGAAWALG